MEIAIIFLFLLVAFLFYKVSLLNKHLSVLTFSKKIINKLLLKKGFVKQSEIDIVINESIGDMSEDVGNKIIKNAKDIGISIPKYMDEEELEKYIEKEESKRKNNNLSFTDRMLMENEDFEK